MLIQLSRCWGCAVKDNVKTNGPPDFGKCLGNLAPYKRISPAELAHNPSGEQEKRSTREGHCDSPGGFYLTQRERGDYYAHKHNFGKYSANRKTL